MNQPLRVLMLGESLDRQGGIVSVEKLILQNHSSGVEFEHVSTLVQGSSINKIFGYSIAVVKVFRRLLGKETDLLHIHVSERGSAFRQAFTSLIAQKFGIPVILHTHGSEFHLFYDSLPTWLKTGLSQIFKRCDRVVVLSETWKTFYVNELGLAADRVIVLPNPVQVPLKIPHRASSNQQKVNLVFLGRIGQRKGAFDLIHAFAKIPIEVRKQAQLTLAGDGAVEEAQALIVTLGLVAHVAVKSWLSSEQRDALLEKSDIFILPSYNEGLPMALLEAMSWGLPPIVTPVGGIPEVVVSEKNGLLVQPGDVEQLAAAIQALITNVELRIALGMRARETVLPLDIKNYVNALNKTYYNVSL
jgi:glycosyltransferase involved in cell wall biosynthesis